MNINLSKFKKIASDGKSSTFKHPDGHSITVSHQALSAKARAEMDKMPLDKAEEKEAKGSSGKKGQKFADGGPAKPVDDVPEPNKKAAAEVQAGATESVGTKLSHSWQNLKSGLGLAEGGRVADPTQRHLIPGDKIPNKIEKGVVGKAMAYGGSDEAAGPPLPTADEQEASAAAQHQADARDAIQSDGVLPVEGVAADAITHALAPSQAGAGTPSPGAMPPSAPGETDAPSADLGADTVASGGPGKAAMTPADALDKGGDYTTGMLAGIDKEKQGAEMQAKAEMDAADAQAKSLHEGIQQQHGLIQNAQTIDQKHDADFQNLMDAAQNKEIDPNHYLGSMGTGQKIMTAIGLLAGGLGAGLTGGPNHAQDFINKQIENDINAQKANQSNKVTLLQANMQNYTDKRAALSQTSAMLNGLVAQQCRLAAAQAASPEAAGRLKALEGVYYERAIQQKQQGKMFEFMRQAADSGNTGTLIQAYRMTGNKDMADDLEKRYVPGVGVAGVPIPDSERSKLAARQDLQDKVMKLRQFAQQHSGSVNIDTIAQGKALAGVVQDTYRRAAGEGVFRESEKNFIESLIPGDPTVFFNKWRVDPKLRQIEATNLSTLNGLKKSYGLRPQVMPQESAPILRKQGQ